MMHLISFLINSPMNHTIGTWRHPDDRRFQELGSMGYWKSVGRTLERGLFDAVFFADVPAAYDHYKDSTDTVVENGVCWPNHDPLTVLNIIASVTERLGVVCTKSIAATPPYDLVRAISTLDFVTGGRAGWNVVTGHLRAEHRALGLEQMEHDARYDRADEYLKVCHAFWNGIEPGAVIADRASGRFADPTLVKRVKFDGKYIRTNAVPPVLPSPQGRPVIFQAGSSSRGQKFAVENAEVIFAIQPTEAGMHKFMGEIRGTAKSAGAADPKVTFGVQVVLGGTEEQAKRHQMELADNVPLDAAMARLSGTLGVDFSKYDPDEPIVAQKTQASQGGMATMAGEAGKPRMTLRQAAMSAGISTTMLQIVGTPEQVASEMERIWRETGCTGFNVTPTINNGSMDDFVDQVVPLLQKKNVFRKEYRYATLRENLQDN
ncbi:MAG TPA: NtaA/DmoA family FMN-dependent monooxygenase [Rhizobiaceae bacterium]|nr:NtaA/DmoA family FMN-dependent monooxygenase [Rhizobiaceae bacterium]